LTSTVAGPDVG